MFDKKMYPASEENLVDRAAFKNMGGKITEFMLKWVPTPKEKLKRKEGTHEERNSKTTQHR